MGRSYPHSLPGFIPGTTEISTQEVVMPAYLLILVAILSRLVPHAGWFNFTAVGGALLYFGARRSWREMLAPLGAFMATDYVLTVYTYHYAFHWQGYIPTWIWYLSAMALGQILLHARTSFVRFAAAVVLGPTSFFLISNFSVWFMGRNLPDSIRMYAPTLRGLLACYAAGLPFYRNDLVSTTIVAGLAFGIPVLIRRMQHREAPAIPAR